MFLVVNIFIYFELQMCIENVIVKLLVYLNLLHSEYNFLVFKILTLLSYFSLQLKNI